MFDVRAIDTRAIARADKGCGDEGLLTVCLIAAAEHSMGAWRHDSCYVHRPMSKHLAYTLPLSLMLLISAGLLDKAVRASQLIQAPTRLR